MGMEAKCICRLGNKTSEGKAHLDSNTLTFRGEFRLSIPLRQIKSVEAKNGRLSVTFPEGTAILDLGSQAERWAMKIQNPKGLMDKLGVKPDSRVAVLGVQDQDFLSQLKERTKEVYEEKLQRDSDLIFYAADSLEALKGLKRLTGYLKSNGAIWVVSLKGKQARIKDTDVIAAAKEAGLVAVKVASFSETRTANKLVIPLAKR
jgi:delta 1-pyrroline-5-carboxylate dehydrogenase